MIDCGFEDCPNPDHYPKKSVQVVDYLNEFMIALREQLLSDAKRWGDAWLDKKDVEGQEQGFLGKIVGYLNDFKRESPLSVPGNFEPSIPMPWLKISGYALICWIRENHPEILEEKNNK